MGLNHINFPLSFERKRRKGWFGDGFFHTSFGWKGGARHSRTRLSLHVKFSKKSCGARIQAEAKNDQDRIECTKSINKRESAPTGSSSCCSMDARACLGRKKFTGAKNDCFCLSLSTLNFAVSVCLHDVSVD